MMAASQRNFGAYTPPHMKDNPLTIDVHIVPSTEAPTACGEPPVPEISPAIVYGLFSLTGKRYRVLHGVLNMTGIQLIASKRTV
jgi:isoquinoline 1-oxidoreductase beta subunit